MKQEDCKAENREAGVHSIALEEGDAEKREM
jgi:hypothetical protein